MPNLPNITIDEQGTLPAGSNVIYTCPARYTTSIYSFMFNNASPNDLEVQVTRVNPSSTVTMYSFVLSAGDVTYDNNTYSLSEGDYITVITTAASTNYVMKGQATFTQFFPGLQP